MIWIFVVTLLLCILNVIGMISIMFKTPITYPHRGWLDPTSWWLFYPSMLFQTWFWTVKLGLF